MSPDPSTWGGPRLLHHGATASLYSPGGADSVRLVNNGQYLILNGWRISGISEIGIVRERLLNVQYQLDI